jgi:hypothetical protein
VSIICNRYIKKFGGIKMKELLKKDLNFDFNEEIEEDVLRMRLNHYYEGDAFSVRIGDLDKYDELEFLYSLVESLSTTNQDLMTIIHDKVDIFWEKDLKEKLSYANNIKEQIDGYIAEHRIFSLEEGLNGGIYKYLTEILITSNLPSILREVIYSGLNADIKNLKEKRPVTSFTIEKMLKNKDVSEIKDYVDMFIRKKILEDSFDYNYLTFSDLYASFTAFVSMELTKMVS